MFTLINYCYLDPYVPKYVVNFLLLLVTIAHNDIKMVPRASTYGEIMMVSDKRCRQHEYHERKREVD